MKTTKLLVGASVAALLTGSAFAQVDVVDTNNGDAQIVLASELDLSSSTQSVTAVVDVAAGGSTGLAAVQALAATDDITVTISLSGGLTIDGNLNNGNFTGATASCSVSISAGGADGDTSVSFTSDSNFVPNNCAGGDLTFDIPVNITGSGNVSALIELTATGTDLDDTTYDANTNFGSNFVETASGYTLDVNAGSAVAVDLDESYEKFDANNNSAVVGTVQVTNTAGVLFAAADGGNTAANASDDNQFDGGTLIVTVPSPAGIESVTLDLAAPATEALDANGQATFTLDNNEIDELDGNAIDVVLNVDTNNLAAIANQTISGELSLDAATGSDLTLASLSDDLAELEREGSNTTTFEWVGDSTKSTGNVFRVTGIGASLPTIRVTLANSTADVDGEYEVTPAGSLNNGELIMTAADIENAVGSAFGRADVSWSFEANGITVRRFMVTGGVVSENSTDYSIEIPLDTDGDGDDDGTTTADFGG